MSTGLDPFVDGQGETSYFTTATLKQRIDLVRHLVGFGRQIVVLTGPPGSGKSAMLTQITRNDDDRWHVLTLKAGPTLNGETLLLRLSQELEVDTGEGELVTLNAIRDAVTAASATGHTIVLAIDDADALPADTAGCLAALAHASEPDAEVKVVLSADPGESAIIDQLRIETEPHALLHVVEVPGFSDEQTRQMLHHRWQVAYGDEPFPFSDVEMAQIYQQAAGLPGKAIVLARQVQIMSGGPARTERDPARRLLLGGIAAIALLLMVALFSGNTPDEPEPESALIDLELPAEPILVPAPVVNRESTSANAQPTVSDPAAVKQPAAIRTVEQAQASLPEPVPEPEPEPEPQEAVAAAVDPVSEPEPEPESSTPAQTSPPTPGPAAPQTPPAPPTKSVAVDLPPPAPAITAPPGAQAESPKVPQAPAKPAYTLAWLKSQPNTNYVLQLFGVRDRAAAEKFIRSRQIGNESAVLTTRHAGQPWYVVLYGHYPDRSAALAAIGDLPAKLAGTSPWARPLKSLE